jgi:hypothetical protein
VDGAAIGFISLLSNKLLAQMRAVLPVEIKIPEPIVMLYNWIEQQGYYYDGEDGLRVGFLYRKQQLQDSRTDDQREGGTLVEFVAYGGEHLQADIGGNEPVYRRPHVFARTGADGSTAAFWLNDVDQLKIVHLGSYSGSMLNCILVENAVDFLRLLAIGYDELCWNDEFPAPPNVLNTSIVVEPNVPFQQWVRSTFHVAIPATASEIVRHPAEYGDEKSGDEFCDWCNNQSSKA